MQNENGPCLTIYPDGTTHGVGAYDITLSAEAKAYLKNVMEEIPEIEAFLFKASASTPEQSKKNEKRKPSDDIGNYAYATIRYKDQNQESSQTDQKQESSQLDWFPIGKYKIPSNCLNQGPTALMYRLCQRAVINRIKAQQKQKQKQKQKPKRTTSQPTSTVTLKIELDGVPFQICVPLDGTETTLGNHLKIKAYETYRGHGER